MSLISIFYSTSKIIRIYFLLIFVVGVVKDGISSHAVYSVTVVKSTGSKEIDSWVVYRRYSDFYDFHVRLEERVSNLNNHVSY